jgi:hypothetical protein
MITYQKRILKNGLSVIAHSDKTAQVSAVSVLYKVGSRDEQIVYLSQLKYDESDNKIPKKTCENILSYLGL